LDTSVRTGFWVCVLVYLHRQATCAVSVAMSAHFCVFLLSPHPCTGVRLPSLQQVQIKASTIGNLTTLGGFQALFPSLTFTCNGTINRWMFVGTLRDGAMAEELQYPVLQIWRFNGTANSYVQQSGFTIQEIHLEPVGFGRVISRTPNEPNNTRLLFSVRDGSTQVHDGDILGIYQPPLSASRLVLWHQYGMGPVSYYSETIRSQTLNVSEMSEVRLHPLISVGRGNMCKLFTIP